MQQFTLRKDSFGEIKRKAVIRTVPVMLVASAAGIFIGVSSNTSAADNMNILPVVILIAAVSLAIGLYTGINRQRKLLESYILTIDNHLIKREQLNTPAISLYSNEITEISKSNNGTILIKGRNSSDVIVIPAQVENYNQLETLLQEIKPFTDATSAVSVLNKYQRVLSLISVGLMVCFYISTNKMVIATTGIILIVLMGWSILKVRTNKNIDSKTKRTTLLSVFVLVCTIAMLFVKLSA